MNDEEFTFKGLLVDGDRAIELARAAKDWQITHGSLLKVVEADELGEDVPPTGVKARGVPVSLVPTPWPRRLYDEAVRLQGDFNELYVRLACDEALLEKMLAPLVRQDRFTEILWNIHLESAKMGVVQKLSLGIFRSDYMVEEDQGGALALRQVEFNTFSCAGATHMNRVSDMHHHLHRTGLYGDAYGSPAKPAVSLPRNTAIEQIANALAAAHNAYREDSESTAASAKPAGVLMIVQHANFNVGDERPLEYALWDRGIPTYRLEWFSISDHVELGPNRELLYSSPSCPYSPLEISVVYYRAGLHPIEYDDDGIDARILMETSKAIKCPSILSHLTTFKHVQAELTKTDVLDKLLSKAQAERVKATFMSMNTLDESPDGMRTRRLALFEDTAEGYILKPSLEGGGNNVYGRDIPQAMKNMPHEKWSTYILMKKIDAPSHTALLMSSDTLYEGDAVDEIGIVGACLWRQGEGGDVEIISNKQVGWTFKTKPKSVNEMSVVKGYGFFNSPHLVEDDDSKSAKAT